MIIKENDQVDLEFGKGDICVTSGYYIEGDKKIGTVAFSSQAPREIGIQGDIKKGQECKVGDFPVIMTFKNAKSIDVVIKALFEARENMESDNSDIEMDCEIKRLYEHIKILIENNALECEFEVFAEENPYLDSIEELNNIIEDEISNWGE